MGQGEIARYEQFLLFPQCFQKTCMADTLKPGLVWERVKDFFDPSQHSPNMDDHWEKGFPNIF